MTKLMAKTVIKNKFYIVERDGEKVATIQVFPEGVSFVREGIREKFLNIKFLETKHNIVFEKTTAKQPKSKITEEVYGFPISGKAFHKRWEITRNLPVYTKTLKSKSFYCAGYYLIKCNKHWSVVSCPKLISLNRYQFKGPFKSKLLANAGLGTAND